MPKIIKKMNWVKKKDADTIEGPIERVMREEIMEAFKYLKIRKAPGPTEKGAWANRERCLGQQRKVPGPTEVYTEMIQASGEVGIGALKELCHRILDGK